MAKRIFNVIGWVGTALVFVAVGIKLFRSEWSQYGTWAAWAGLVMVVAYMASQWRETATAMNQRQTRLGTIALSSVVLVLGLLVALNYLASRRNHRWDLTANQQYSLSPQTKQILQKLDAPVHVRVFDKPDKFESFRDRLGEYQYDSNKVSVDYIDADKQPVLANQYKVQSYGTVVFEYKGRTERVTSAEESQLTNALIKVITGQERKAYFTTGHGERDTAANERAGYSTIASGLGSENFKLDTLVLLQQQKVPDDASVVVVAGPTTDFLAPEIEALRKYLQGGGKVFLMLDPPGKVGVQPLTNLIAFAKEWGIEVGDNIVVDVSGVGQLIGTDASVPVVAPPGYLAHAITENFRLLTAYPLARSVKAVPGGTNGHTAQNLLETSKNSWGETDIEALLKTGKVDNDKTKDLQGPVTLGAAMQEAVKGPEGDKDKKDDKARPEARLVVMGDSDFAANYAIGIQGNRDMFLNVMSWLAQQENMISIRPKDADDRRITMTSAQQKATMWFALLILPAMVFSAGVMTWARRRK
jgi:ABC-type uncharacterized transport system involved in gliding motility auxiliary subunit